MDHKIRIGNLPETATKFELEDLLTMVADIQHLRLESSDDRGHIEMVAYAHVASPQDVQNLVDRFNGSSFRGRTITVRDDKPFVPDPALIARAAAKRAGGKRSTAKRATAAKRPPIKRATPKARQSAEKA